MKQFVLLLCVAISLISGLSGADMLRLERSMDAMGSTYTIVAYGPDRGKLDAAVDNAFQEAERLDSLLSNYRPQSEWSRVNSAAGKQAVAASPELFRLLSACLAYSRQSEGAFDITVGPLLKTWGFYRGSGRVPHRAEIRGALSKVGYQNIQLDSAARTVRFTRPGVEMDPGGIGKGYAVDKMAQMLRQGGITSAFISAGSSSLYAIGAPPGQPGWPVSVRHPKSESKTVAQIVLKDESMSTSGSYEKFFWANGKIYSHIFDPRTGYPAQGMLSVSVVAPNTLDSEAWTKPFFILGRAWAKNHKPRGFRVFMCEDKPEVPCAWLP